MKYLLTTILLLVALVLVTTEVDAAEISGQASYYSRAGCLGCDSAFIMANGEALIDSGLTIALTPEMVHKYKLLNDWVGIINPINKQWVIARVTDTGGFGKYNRVADLSVGTKEALGCKSLCNVIIVF